MSDEFDLSISDDTFKKILEAKRKLGFKEKSWDEWFSFLFKDEKKGKMERIEEIAKGIFYDTVYDLWIQNFALNLNAIWQEPSAKELSNLNRDDINNKKNSAIVIGRGPSIYKHKHLEMLSESKFNGSIVCTDGALANTLKAGVTPEKFPKFYVVTIDVYPVQRALYDHKIVDEFGSNIKGIFSTLADPSTVQRARDANIKVHWLHPLVDYDEGQKSLNYITAKMVRAKKDHGLLAIQTGGNVGTSCWFVAWQVLKCNTIALIGMNHGWEEDNTIEYILSHGNNNKLQNIDRNSITFQRLFPKIYNPEFDTYCILDPIFQYYSGAFKEFIARSPLDVKTINATEGGSIFGERIHCMKFAQFLDSYK